MIAYLDNSATTKPCDAAVAAVTDALTQHWHNPSSLYEPGNESHRMLEAARAAVAGALGAEPGRVFFTSGGTEADNWAIFGATRRMAKRGHHIITTAYEHHAVLGCFGELEKQGWDVTYLQPDAQGRITTDDLKAALRPDTVFVSVMMVNNEVGAVLPIAEMAKAVHRVNREAIFHTDAVQGFLKVPFRAGSLGADLISISGHKVHGPKGVGALYIRKDLPLPALLFGGGQESAYRSGTEAMPAICGFGAACAALAPTARADIAHMERVKLYALEVLSDVPGLVILGAHDAPQIVNLSVPGLRSQGILNCLQSDGVYVSAGSACARGHRSHVLASMGADEKTIDGSIRVSLCRDSTTAEIDLLHESLRRAVKTLKG
ncbi:MAG: cysteine desulfurase family protein [Oscillospiraceae bacterium]|nr:cysteine desulfurase family protein [Oscillospiraceae bacterium]